MIVGSKLFIPMLCLSVFVFAMFQASAQDTAKPSPHLGGGIIAPPGIDEVAYCDKCHTTGCPMPHPEHRAVTWPVNGKLTLSNGMVTCSSCHTPGFRHRTDAFLARDQKGLCSPCHYGAHVLPNAHPFGTPCSSCHTEPKVTLVAGQPKSAVMVDSINGECLRCHYDGPITHPVGIPNTKKAAPDLPLGKAGDITCVTCHYGHSDQNANGNLLRKNNKRGGLCLSCHDDL
jgi:predicted CXXCH cytochrome family protein